MPCFVRIFLLTFFLYASIAGNVNAKQTAKNQDAPTVIDLGGARAVGMIAKDSIAAKSLSGKVPAQESSASRPSVIQFIGLIVSIIVVIYTIKTFYIRKEEREQRNNDAAKKKESELKEEVKFQREKKVQLLQNNDEAYRDRLIKELGESSVFSLPGIDGSDEAVNLPDTFVPLDISVDEGERAQGDKTPEKALEYAVTRSRMLLIIGEPGSGKTTIINHFALSSNIKLSGFKEPVPLLYMPLRKMDASGDVEKSLAEKLSNCFEPHLEIDKSFFDDRLKNQKSLVLLDGLDEISDNEQRIQVCIWLSEAAKEWDKAFFVITTRGKGFGEEERNALKIKKTTAYVKPFTIPQQNDFLKKWFCATYLRNLYRDKKESDELQKQQTREAALKTAEELAKYLAQPENTGLRELAAIPLLLQIMAILWKQNKTIPDDREELYRIALDYLLYSRENDRNIKPLLPPKQAKLLLAPISLWMQDDEIDTAEEIDMHQKMQDEIEKLEEKKFRALYAVDICDNFVKRAGVLGRSGKTYLFSHKTFREYLVSIQLLNSVNDEDKRLQMLVDQVGNPWWNEPLLFFMAQVSSALFERFMQAFFESRKHDTLDRQTLEFLKSLIRKAPQKTCAIFREKLLDKSTALVQKSYLLECLKTIGTKQAVDAAKEFITQYPTVDKELRRKADEVIASDEHNASILLDLNIATQQKSSDGIVKPLTDVYFSPVEQNAQYILIKDGCCSAYSKEPVGDLYVAKYPVTNKLYRKFIDYLQSVDNGQVDDILSSELFELAKTIPGFQTVLGEVSELSKQFRSKFDDDRRFKEDEQPVVGVSWYAARTYCLWLSLLESQGKKTNQYRLPIEREWEYAAAGKEKRKYPWPTEKGEPTSKLLNYNSNVGTTTPVGSYPEGATPEGLYDMAGNVWEWTDSWYDEKTRSTRVLRGGGWGSNAGRCRSAYRGGSTPANRDNSFGFRLVFVP